MPKSLPAFEPGRVVTTRSVAAWMAEDDARVCAFVVDSLVRHCACDWGQLDAHDRRANEVALIEGDRILSSYPVPDDIALDAPRDRLWVLTESDRSATTVLSPDDY